MRAMTPQLSSKRKQTPEASTLVSKDVSPRTVTPTLDPSIDTASATQHKLCIQCTHYQPLDLLAEKNALKKELSDLREERRILLDHSTESDQRLIQFTHGIFRIPSSSLALKPALPNESCTSGNKVTLVVEETVFSAMTDFTV